ncbi:hypothetical protein [Longimicrobium sp.]|uniref:hypothetical protein n=1 Tax=Longimicrobium sp. TaxID=2029185 RepID=UPI003B3AF432
MKMMAMRRRVFGAGTAVALGFGGAQAFAAPAPVAPTAQACNQQVCDRICDLTNRGLGGFCSSAGICVCYR